MPTIPTPEQLAKLAELFATVQADDADRLAKQKAADDSAFAATNAAAMAALDRIAVTEAQAKESFDLKALDDYLNSLINPAVSVAFLPGPAVPRKESDMPKCKLFKGKAGAKLAGAPVKATTDLSFTDLQNGTGTFGGLDAAGNAVPLDPAVWSLTPAPTIAPDTTVIASITVSGLSVTFVGTGKASVPGSPVQVTFTVTNSTGTPAPITVVVPVDVTVGPASQVVFVPGTPVVR